MHAPRHASNHLIKGQALKSRIVRPHKRELLSPKPSQRIITAIHPDGSEVWVPGQDFLRVGGEVQVLLCPACADEEDVAWF